jgi:3-dehydroquinate dehydratase type I
MEQPMKVCGCLLDAEPAELPRLLGTVEVDLVEWRLDAFVIRYGQAETLEMLAALGSTPRRPILVTNRPKRQGGLYHGLEAERLEILEAAVKLGAEWVDLEGDVDREWRERLRARGARVLVSHHDFAHTPETAVLQGIARNLAAGADGIKIVTTARRHQDCWPVLGLIPWGRETLQMDVVAFCMGTPGRWSRVASLLLGSPWTYVRLADGQEAAPGQYTAAEMRTLLEMLA